MSHYNLGPVKPWVERAANEVGHAFGITTILGYGTRGNVTDHDDGLALDFMTRNGTNLANHLRSHARVLGITYVIWNQRIWSVARNAEGWRPMEDRGSDTANHKDHVHASFTAHPPPSYSGPSDTGSPQHNGHPTPTNPGVYNPGGGHQATNAGFTQTAADLAEATRRVALFGAAIILGSLLIAIGAARTTRPAREAVHRVEDATIKKGLGA